MGDSLFVSELQERLVAAEASVAALRESEQKYRSLFESIDDGFAIIETVRDFAGKLVDLSYRETNSAYARHIGFRIFPGLRLKEVIPDIEDEWMAYYDRVSSTGISETKESFNGDVKRWFRTSASRIGAEESQLIGVVLVDATERKLAEQVLRESEERQAFLLKLSDALRPLDDANKVADAACRLLAEELKASRVEYTVTLDDMPGEEVTNVEGECIRNGVALVRHFPMNAFGNKLVDLLRAGETLVITHIDGDDRITEDQRAVLRSAESQAAISVPRVKAGRLVMILTVHDRQPRPWTAREISLVEDVAERTWSAVERAHAEAALRESEARLAHDLEATQVLQNIGNQLISKPGVNGHFNEICEAARALMRSNCASIQVYDEAGSRLLLVGNAGFHPDSAAFWEWVDAGVGSSCGRALITGDRVIVRDMDLFEADAPDLEAYRQSAILSVQSTPLIARTGQIVGMMSTHWHRRDAPVEASYRFFDILARLAADFIVRIRAEAALRESDERFQQFAGASSGALWIRDAASLKMEYVSPAISRIYGLVEAELSEGLESWAAHIVPEDRDVALAHVEQVREGRAVVHEFRIQRPADKTFRWIRNTAFPLRNQQGVVQRIGGIAEDITEAKLLAEHQGVLLAELQHRVRNIMAVIRSVAIRTSLTVDDVKTYSETLEGRLLTLARVQALLTLGANVGVSMHTVVQDELLAQATHAGQFEVAGPDIVLPPKAAEVLTLAIHELTTNAVKYGALSAPAGHVRASWSIKERHGEPWMDFSWEESGAPAKLALADGAPRRRGFGSELIEARIPYELGGTGSLSIEPGGARCHITFPLKQGASILETDAPERSIVFGGSIDMTGESNLSGYNILVLEDDFYLAWDTSRALVGAGATVSGPCANVEQALRAMAQSTPDGAVIDINLGEGLSFKLPRTLKDRGIPFVFFTGYDQDSIPEEFATIPRLQKPVELRRVVNAMAEALGS